MIYSKLVEIGRVVFITKGKDEGKLAVIVNVLDSNRALIDGPSSGVKRYVRNFNDLELTRFKVKIRVGMRTTNVRKAYDDEKIEELWSKTSWAKKLAKKRMRASLTDFQRFKVFKAKQLRNRLVNIELAKVRKAVAAK